MTFDAFARLASAGADGARLVPVWRDILLDADTPVAAFAKLRRPPFAFLLESAPAGGETWARYTFLGTEPRAAWRLADGVVDDWTPERGWHGARRVADPLGDLAEREAFLPTLDQQLGSRPQDRLAQLDLLALAPLAAGVAEPLTST